MRVSGHFGNCWPTPFSWRISAVAEMPESARYRVGIITQFGAWSASTRARALQYVEPLEAHGLDLQLLLANDRPVRHPGRIGQVRYFATHAWRYLRRYFELRRSLQGLDAVLVQRGVYAMGPGLVVRPLERFAGRVVLDLDDDLFSLTPSMEGKGRLARWIYGPQQAARLVRRADHIVVSTERLASALPKPHGPVVVLPTVPQVERYAVSISGGEDGLIGWAGTTGGLRYLDPLREVFTELSSMGQGHLRVVSSEPWNGPSEFVEWQQEDEHQMFANWAVGIMPLPNTEYAKAKAGYKLLQYMAAGVACIASPVGVNCEIISESGAGLLASTPEEWKQALLQLLGNRELRQSMGQAGREFVLRYSDPTRHADLLRQALMG